jgi:predicted heme/steroid binding protein/uncharacterized membrane protein
MRPFISLITLLAITGLAIFAPAISHATEELSRDTGLACSACHQNPQGGGELTSLGEQLAAAISSSGTAKKPSPFSETVRLLVGYLHILAGVVWFGAIFYVHILLKPAYAAKGLPRGELVLGWVCIITVGITGVVLTYMRIHSPAALLSSRFGVLLAVKIMLYLVMAGSAALVTFVLGPRMQKRITQTAAKEGAGGEYTPEELKPFDGREGRRALIAFRGELYDVTGSLLWKEGKHARHLAGEDLTLAIKQAPHGPEKLDGFPKAGVLVPERSKPSPDRPKAAFYFMAYMNLVIIFLVLAIIALWRWW